MVDTLVAIQGGQKGDFFSEALINYDEHEKGDKRLYIVLFGLWEAW